MFLIKIYKRREGDLQNYPDAHLDVTLDQAKAAAAVRLDGAYFRDLEANRPERARIFLLSEDGPHMLAVELLATDHGAVQVGQESGH